MDSKGFIGVLSIMRDRIVVEDVIRIMHNLMLFNPTSFRSNPQSFKRLGKNNFWDQVRLNLDNHEYFRSYAKEFKQNPIRLNELSVSFYPTTDIIQIRFIIDTEDDAILTQLENSITDFSKNHIILSAALRTIGEYDWNENKDLELQKRNHQEIDEIQTIRIAHVDYADVNQFSGHTNEYEGIWFGCSYEMWFGKDYNRYISLDIISQFKECEFNTLYENETVHIKMFKSHLDFAQSSSMRRAFSFREKTNCDSAFVYWKKEIIKQSIDRGQQSTEIEKGSFPHGGIRQVKSYLDQNDQLTIKAKAVKVHISELRSDGKVVYEEIVDL